MLRYVTLAWNGLDHRERATARRLAQRLQTASDAWRCALGAEDLMVFCAGERSDSGEVRVLQSDTGVVLGRLFKSELDGSGASTSVALDENETSRILRSRGRHLFEHYWGRYVAFLRGGELKKTWVLREPTGGLPCFVTSLDGVRIFFSDIQGCASLALLECSINWDYVEEFLCQPLLMLGSDATGLNGVLQVPAGECLEIPADGTAQRIQFWNPFSIARSDPIEDIDDAVMALRRTCATCVAAWASCYPRVIHLLSGGLDSSIILSCLGAAPSRPTITCLNYFDASSESDERIFARLMASATGSELIECEERASTVRLESILNVSRSAIPWSYLYFVQHGEFQGELARVKKATAIFTGTGGDQVFYQSPVVMAAADYVYRYGMRKRFLDVAHGVARMQGASLWSVLGVAIRNGLLRSHNTPLQYLELGAKLVSTDTIESFRHNDDLVHRLGLVEGVAPGKILHALMLMIGCWDVFYDPIGSTHYPDRVHPLLSQPLIELCLRIPTYVLTAGGWDRAIARRAFERELPPEIVARRSKGGNDAYLRQLLQCNLKFVRELLLDGVLVQENLIDRHRLESVLSQQRASLAPEAGEVLVQHLNIEVWLRGWTTTRRKAAA